MADASLSTNDSGHDLKRKHVDEITNENKIEPQKRRKIPSVIEERIKVLEMTKTRLPNHVKIDQPGTLNADIFDALIEINEQIVDTAEKIAEIATKVGGCNFGRIIAAVDALHEVRSAASAAVILPYFQSENEKNRD